MITYRSIGGGYIEATILGVDDTGTLAEVDAGHGTFWAEISDLRADTMEELEQTLSAVPVHA